MIKSDSHDSGVDHYSPRRAERLIDDEAVSRARRARRQSRNNSATTTSGDETRRAVPEVHLRPPPARERRRSPNQTDLPPLSQPTIVTVENETKSRRKKKTFKEREGEDIEMNVRKRSGSRQRARQRKSSKEAPTGTERTTEQRRAEEIVGIIVHRTDRLKTDLRLRHPFVRVHCVDINTRSYVRKTDPNRLSLRYQNQTEQLSDFIPPISTQPYDFNINRSTIPSWEQMLILNEDFSHLSTVDYHNVVVLFEVLDFLDTQQNPDDRSRSFPIAWGFLKIIGTRNNLNTGRMTRLQLWLPNEHLRGAAPGTSDVSLWYFQGKHEKYPSTLYVTIKPLNSPSSFRPGLRSATEGGLETMREEYRHLQSTLDGRDFGESPRFPGDTQKSELDDETMGPLDRVAQLPPRWQKLTNSKCKIPTELSLSLNAGERGCSAVRFSHNGYFLACAEVSKAQQNHLITIYELPRGQRVTVFSGHLQMIYDLDWSKTDRYLASASADSFVKIWNFEKLQRKPWRSLAHPSYVYCARFHPNVEEIVVTAGYDKIMRIWHLEKKHGSVIRTMADHLGYISNLSFNPDGTRLASVDSVGAIKVWNALPNETSGSQSFADSWTMGASLDFAELQNVPLNSVNYSPGDHYLLVSGRDNLIVLVDVRTKSISRRYIGAFNIQDRIRCCFSTCGSMVFSGSEDRQVYCWQTYNGNLLYSYKTLNYTQPVMDIQFHPHDNLLAMCSIGPQHQVNLFQHTFNDADIEAKPFQTSTPGRGGLSSVPPTTASMGSTDLGQRPPPTTSNRYDSSARYPNASGTERSADQSRAASSSGESPRGTATTKNETRNRRLAVVNKILDDMDDVINPKSSTSRPKESIPSYGGGNMMSRSTERDVSPYQARRSIPNSGYTSDSGRPPLVSPLRGLTSPDLFVPATNRTDDDDDYAPQKSPSSSSSASNVIMYATITYRAQAPEELSFSKNDQIKILNKESHLLWYAERLSTRERGYISPNRVHINAKDAAPQPRSASRATPEVHSISEIPRLDHNSRRIPQKSVKFDNFD